MGIVQRQSIKKSALNFFGAAVGAISTFMIYPLAIEVHGLLYFLKAAALMSIPFANLGIKSLVIRYFPKFKDPESGHNGFLVFLLLVSCLFFLLFLIPVSFLWDYILQLFSQKESAQESSIIPVYLWYFVPLTFLMININILIDYISNFHRIVIPSVLYDLFMKVVSPVLILLYVYQIISLDLVVLSFTLAHIVVVGLLLFYLYTLNELKITWPSKLIFQEVRPMANYAIFSLLGSLGNLLATQLDTLMVGSLKTDFDTGIYANSLLITSAILIPQRAILAITAPLVADAWSKNEISSLKSLYQKSSINLLLAGGILLLMVMVNLEDLCALLPEKNGEIILKGQTVILLLGFGVIFDMATSINGHIMYYSDYYRVSFYMIIILGVINIFLNLYLIPKYGINGAAAATAISLLTYNLLKTVYVYFKFKIHPFTWSTAKFLVIMAFLILISYLLPESAFPLVNLIVRSSILGICFALSSYFWKISQDGNQLIDQALKVIKSKWK